MKLYAPNGVFMAQHFPTAVGNEAVRKAYDMTFDAITLSVDFNIIEVVPINDEWAFARTASAGTTKLKAGGGGPEANQELFVMQKIDGVWKIARTDSLPRSPRAERLDPFETYPESRIVGVDVLMKHYLRSAVYENFPWQPASETNPTTTFLVPLIWSDTVLFHAALQLSSIRLKNRQSCNSDRDMKTLSGECIRLLRDRVESSGTELQVSDETISAVAMLATMEHEKGNLRMMRMHLDGLKKMVDLRGGLSSIRETNPMVANSIFWAFAVASYEVPYPNLDPVLPTPFSADHGLLSLPAGPFVSHFQDFDPSYEPTQSQELQDLGVQKDIASVVTSIQHVSQLVPTNSYPTASTSQVILTRMCSLLSFLLSIQPINASLVGDNVALISESMRLCTLLHVLTPWRGLAPDGTITINLLLHQLISSLKLLLGTPTNSTNMVMLWMFCTGAVAADKMPERLWFVGHLVEMTEEMGIRTWEEMKALVSRVIWHERLHSRPYVQLWGEIEEKRKESSDD
ncbi:hypothetical protein LSUE1_G000681 [Lachnellula suecica]|uniref:SnoaL-like domain-containing protein n=1 Tax=Lachnellula suecica TaxID=602035 RepID=A0A8T9CQD3_9HELO|nr:hypothetical protein LSUE1_G000681 [Lachnellula suecica]